MKLLNRFIYIALPLLVLTACIFPVMSTTLTDGEMATITVRGYNLITFSPISTISLLSPILFILIMFSCTEQHTKEIMLIALLTLSAVGFASGFNQAREWLMTTGGFVKYDVRGMLYIILSPIIAIIPWIANKNSKDA